MLLGRYADATAMESSLEVPQKIKNGTLYDPANPRLGIHTKELKTQAQRDVCTPLFTAALFTAAKRWKQPKRPSPDE